MAEICFNCFRNKPDGGVCPFCGYDHTGSEEKFPLALKPGTILANRYYLGRVLGQGGFGITYIALDGNTQSRVAIKEYLPRELAMRDQYTQSLQIYSANDRENFEYGKQQFLDEARTLAQFYGNEHIISILSYFEENGTAYFAMEYMEGVNLKQYMEQLGRTLEVYEANRILLPVMESLEWVHSKGIIHRDISPDNIMIRRDGTAKLIDFGSARYSTGEVSRSLDVILKHGFAPREQYTRRGRQGPFTDVYAMAATYYYAITGKVPPDAIDRTEKDELIRPSSLGVKIRRNTETALLKGLAVSAADRWQTMREFYSAMVQSMPNPFQPEEEKIGRRPARESEKPQKKQSETPKPQIQKSKKRTTAAVETSHAETARRPEETSPSRPRKKGGLVAVLLLLAAAVIVAGVLFLKPVVLPTSKPEATETASAPVPTTEDLPTTPTTAPTPKPIATSTPTLTPTPTQTPTSTATPVPISSPILSPIPTTPAPTPSSSSTPILEILDYEVGDTLFFGSYEQDNMLVNGPEPIEWQVLDRKGDRILVISRYALDCQLYNAIWTDVTWETCSLREWLNDTFLNTAFNTEEQTTISTVTVNADKNPDYKTDPGNSTEDMIFLLSVQEANTYFNSEEERKCAPTEYAIGQRAWTIDTYKVDEKSTCWWWLRSLGDYSYHAVKVDLDGSIDTRGSSVNSDGVAIRPSLWIDLEAAGLQDTVNTDLPAPTPTPIPASTVTLSPTSVASDFKVGDYVLFGTYEQDNNPDNDKEDIEWLVLAKENNRLLVISRYALDCQRYNTEYTIITWEACSLRNWLNKTFLQEAFTAEERAMIPSVTVSADKNPKYSTNPGNSTKDHVFLLSISEADTYFDSAEARKCAPTAYAKAQGAYTNDSFRVDRQATCWWWLRSPGCSSGYAAHLSSIGSVSNSGCIVDCDDYAVRPALWINLES